MTRFIVRRVISMFIVVFVVATATFFLMHAIPGGPFKQEKDLPPSIEQAINKRYGLDKPLWEQYTNYLGNLIKGDLGPSFKYEGISVNKIIKDSFPISAKLGSVAILLALLVGIPAGIISALRPYTWQDSTAMFLAVLGISVPSFVLAPFFQAIFANWLHWFPTARWGTPAHYVLPALSLAAYPMATFARYMRSTMMEVLQQDFIRTARAKGLPGRIVVYRHALKNAILPVITVLGPMIAGILTGSFVIETIFAIPGLGRYYVTSISNRDYTTIIGVTIFYAFFLVLMNIIVDISYAYIDPRIQILDDKE